MRAHIKRMNGTKLIVAVVVAVGLLMAALIVRGYQSSSTDLKICRGQNTLRKTFREVIRSSDASLGKPGSPGFAYYRAHPEELGPAHRANHRLIVQLSDIDCKHLPTVNPGG